MADRGSAGGAMTSPPPGRRPRTSARESEITVVKRSLASAVLLLTTVGSTAMPAATATGTPAWHSYVLGPRTAQVGPVGADSRGTVTHLDTLVRGNGRPTTLTT